MCFVSSRMCLRLLRHMGQVNLLLLFLGICSQSVRVRCCSIDVSVAYALCFAIRKLLFKHYHRLGHHIPVRKIVWRRFYVSLLIFVGLLFLPYVCIPIFQINVHIVSCFDCCRFIFRYVILISTIVAYFARLRFKKVKFSGVCISLSALVSLPLMCFRMPLFLGLAFWFLVFIPFWLCMRWIYEFPCVVAFQFFWFQGGFTWRPLCFCLLQFQVNQKGIKIHVFSITKWTCYVFFRRGDFSLCSMLMCLVSPMSVLFGWVHSCFTHQAHLCVSCGHFTNPIPTQLFASYSMLVFRCTLLVIVRGLFFVALILCGYCSCIVLTRVMRYSLSCLLGSFILN